MEYEQQLKKEILLLKEQNSGLIQQLVEVLTVFGARVSLPAAFQSIDQRVSQQKTLDNFYREALHYVGLTSTLLLIDTEITVLGLQNYQSAKERQQEYVRFVNQITENL